MHILASKFPFSSHSTAVLQASLLARKDKKKSRSQLILALLALLNKVPTWRERERARGTFPLNHGTQGLVGKKRKSTTTATCIRYNSTALCLHIYLDSMVNDTHRISTQFKHSREIYSLKSLDYKAQLYNFSEFGRIY